MILAHRGRYDGHLNYICPFPSILVHVNVHSLPSPAWPRPIYHDSYAVLFFTTSDFTFTTRHIHNWASFPPWPRLFILSGATSNCPLLFPSRILDTFQPGGSSFGITSFYLYILFMRSSRQEYPSGLPFPSPVDHVLLELFTMTCPSWMALHSMPHSFIELCRFFCHNKAVIYERVSVVTIDIIITLNIKANWMKKL